MLTKQIRNATNHNADSDSRSLEIFGYVLTFLSLDPIRQVLSYYLCLEDEERVLNTKFAWCVIDPRTTTYGRETVQMRGLRQVFCAKGQCEGTHVYTRQVETIYMSVG